MNVVGQRVPGQVGASIPGQISPIGGVPTTPATLVEKPKPKPKPKTAAAGGGANPPKNPPKGPTGPKDPNKRGNFGDKPNKGKPTDSSTSLGGLQKNSGSQFNDRRSSR
jgi:hypothetical protein